MFWLHGSSLLEGACGGDSTKDSPIIAGKLIFCDILTKLIGGFE
jgi:hypothetical protein